MPRRVAAAADSAAAEAEPTAETKVEAHREGEFAATGTAADAFISNIR